MSHIRALKFTLSDRSEVSDYPELSSYEEQEPYAPEAESSQPAGLEIYDARALRIDGPVLIFEFEVPCPGFMLPDDGMTVRVFFDDGTVRDAFVLGGDSSPAGPHHPGFTIRLALKLEDPYTWNQREAQICWTLPETGEVNLHIALGF